jgi:trehalose synthase
LHEVALEPRSIAGLESLAKPAHLARFRSSLASVAGRLDGRTLWHVNSTSEGGGVAELLHQLLGYLIEGGIRCRWVVVEGDQEFFSVTKRIHNRLHGVPGDGGELGDEEGRAYMTVLRSSLETLLEMASPGDVAVLHDPQTAGMIGPLRDAGLRVIWVCHVGVDDPNDLVRSAWDFLMPHVHRTEASVFSRRAYVWEGLPRRRTRVIPPCIDPTSPKNADLAPAEVAAVLMASAVVGSPDRAEATIELEEVGPVHVRSHATTVEEAPAPIDAPLIVQVSRWDRLKDHLGVMRAFARHVRRNLDAHLLLVGPATDSVSDDPEGAEVLAENVAAWQRLPDRIRGRVHLVSLPVDDRVENAVVVNALQREADVVVQKSLAEGFGLTVAEAMWKRRPVVGGRVGGIQDQIVDGRSGLLVDPLRPRACGQAITSLVADLGFAQAIGHAGRQRVRNRFLPPHFLGAHLDLIDRVLTSST